MADQSDRSSEGEQGRRRQGFIPGLLNALVLEHIATKIPWSSMYALTWVSGEWRKAIRSREIYDVRKRCDALQSMVVVPVKNRDYSQKGFHDVENQGTYLFPVKGEMHKADYCPPGLARTVSAGSPIKSSTLADPQEEPDLNPWWDPLVAILFRLLHVTDDIVALNGKLYAIQESRPGQRPAPPGENFIEIQVFDVAACDWEWRCCCKWRKCPNARDSIHTTEIWVVCDGKIFSFHTCNTCFHGKVFDPENEMVTEIKNKTRNVCRPFYKMSGTRFGARLHAYRKQVAVLNKQIYVGQTPQKHPEKYMMVFDSRTETWHIIPNSLNSELHIRNDNCNYFSMIVVKEKIYYFTQAGTQAYIQVYNTEFNSWTTLDGSFAEDLLDESGFVLNLTAVTPYRNEVAWLVHAPGTHKFADGTWQKFYKSVGFGVEGRKLTWEDFPDHGFSSLNDVIGRLSDLRLESLEL